ncbi:MAG: hypothetical protein IT373_24865 [Polyangiaceae bacterium]|nr:hypothetical protein [Polyangiaceae bacterium]
MLVGNELRARNLPGVVVGKLVALGPGVTVAFDERPEGVPARSTLALAADDVGREVTLVFERGLVERPIVTGVIRPDAATDKHHLEVDGDRLVLSAARQIELRCGKASIVLTRAGKVLIHGAYVSSRASGVNRIRGGSVDIN